MNKIIFTKLGAIIFFIVVFSSQTYSQYEITNIEKYWNYRERFRNSFVSVGSNAGQSLPFTIRNERNSAQLNQIEGPIMLGQYLVTLASEYQLLKMGGFSTKQTRKELYYALYAFNRLDLHAETTNGYNLPEDLDGFFVRWDYPENFVQNNVSLNQNLSSQSYFTEGSGKPGPVLGIQEFNINKACPNDPAHYFSSKYTHTPMSLDQTLGVLMGSVMVSRLVDAKATYEGKEFQDGEISIQKEANSIIKRLISNAATQNWNIKEPDGDNLGNCGFENESNGLPGSQGGWLTYSYSLNEISKRINGESYPTSSISRILDEFNQAFANSHYNKRMYIEAITLCDCFARGRIKVKETAQLHNWNILYYNMGIVLNNWKEIRSIKSDTESALNTAPTDGPFYHSLNDFSGDGWAADNRFGRERIKQEMGVTWHEGNYSGLDYMMMHNLYLLAYDNYGVFKTPYGMLNAELFMDKPHDGFIYDGCFYQGASFGSECPQGTNYDGQFCEINGVIPGPHNAPIFYNYDNKLWRVKGNNQTCTTEERRIKVSNQVTLDYCLFYTPPCGHILILDENKWKVSTKKQCPPNTSFDCHNCQIKCPQNGEIFIENNGKWYISK